MNVDGVPPPVLVGISRARPVRPSGADTKFSGEGCHLAAKSPFVSLVQRGEDSLSDRAEVLGAIVGGRIGWT